MCNTDSNHHGEIRANVRKRLLHAAEKMAEKYNASKRIKTVQFKLGEFVTVKIPSQDRAPCDMSRLPGIITEINNGFHKVKTQYGVLKTQYRSDQLERCPSLSSGGGMMK